jgi:hypothetical protein
MPIYILASVVPPDAKAAASSEKPHEPLAGHVRQVTREFPRLGIVVDERRLWGSRTRFTLTVSGNEDDLHALKKALRPAVFEQVDPFRMA